MTVVLRTAYWQDLAARRSFQEFIKQIFGLDFGRWESAGYRDDARVPVSQVFSAMNPKSVMYHVLYRLRDHAWRIPGLDAVVLMKRDVPAWRPRELPGENLHMLGEIDLGPQPVLPFTSQA